LHEVGGVGERGVLELGDPAGEVLIRIDVGHLLRVQPGGEVERTEGLPRALVAQPLAIATFPSARAVIPAQPGRAARSSRRVPKRSTGSAAGSNSWNTNCASRSTTSEGSTVSSSCASPPEASSKMFVPPASRIMAWNPEPGRVVRYGSTVSK